MNYFEVDLHPDILGIWTVEEQAARYNRSAILPDSTVELVINCGAPLLLNEQHVLPRGFVKGLQQKPLVLRAQGDMALLVGVRLKAWSLPGLPDARFDRAHGTIIPLDGIWQDFARTISDTVSRSGYAEAIFSLEEFLNTTYQQHDSLQTLSTAGQLLYESRGTIQIQELADRSHISLSQLERRFKGVTGITLKKMARLVRFEAARDSLFMNPAYKLAELAHELGYVDQAHFTHDFKSFAGFTPGSQNADFLQDTPSEIAYNPCVERT